ncbi:MAG: GNAT family N-acetyltransferase [Aerococcus sp.]|nr:GNAT family N-acetyltransferase [Aerococcus sp.]
MLLTFRDLFVGASDYDDTDAFSAYFNRYTPKDPNVNALWLDFSPRLDEWEMLLSYFEDYAFDLAEQGTLITNYSFRWPDNVGVHSKTLDEMAVDGFQLGQYALLQQPASRTLPQPDHPLTIQPVTESNWEDYNALQQTGNAAYGTRYQAAKAPYYAFTREWPSIRQYGLYQDQTLAGAFELIEGINHVELDQLLIRPDYQGQGIGTVLLTQLMTTLPHPLVMKVDREDEAVMHFYQQLNCQEIATQIMAMAPFSDEFISELADYLPD